jgi:hypothetical protein
MDIDKLVIMDFLNGLCLGRKLFVFNPNTKSLDPIEFVALNNGYYQLNIEKEKNHGNC